MSEWVKTDGGINIPPFEDSERDLSIDVLLIVVDDFDGEWKYATGRHSEEDQSWYDLDGNELEFCTVTHWQMLPSPPSGFKP